MRLFPLRGGVHPPGHKELTAGYPIEAMPLPRMLYLPLQQHIGAPAKPCVQVGQRVLKGQVLAVGQGPLSAPIHAPTSGLLAALQDYTAPHPSGLTQATLFLEPDGRDEWGPRPAEQDPFALFPPEVSRRVSEAGVVGLGGAAFPSAIKLNLRHTHRITTLVVNGAECEPYLTCDDRLMQEQSAEVMDGIAIMAHGLEVSEVFVAIENNKPQAAARMKEAAKASPLADIIRVVAIPTRYPMGSEKHLVAALTGQETPSGKLTADLGVVVHNVATACAVSQVFRQGRPLIDRVVTVSGLGIGYPGNFRVALGTRLSDLLSFAGGLAVPGSQLIMGGPMMGMPVASLDAPVVKGTNGLLALTQPEMGRQPASPCIRCGACMRACPSGLLPLEMARFIKREEMDQALRLGIMDCISCGSCSYACPSAIPLVQYFNYAKGQLRLRAAEERKRERIRQLSEAKQLRMEKAAQARAQAAAARKAARDAAKKG